MMAENTGNKSEKISTPLVSIITVSFNAEDTIGKTASSIGIQTFKDFEWIVIDGKSSDRTCRIIKEAGVNNTVLTSEPDNGLYDAMNKGLKKAKGKYVIFLNAGDTFLDNSVLEKFASKASEDADIIYGDTVIVDKNGEKIGSRHLKAPEHLTFESFSDGMLICHQAFMVKKSLAPEYDLAYRFSSDYDWCVKCIKNSNPNKCHNLRMVTTAYLSAGLTDKNKIKSLRERYRIMARHYGMMKTLRKHLSFVFRALKRGSI